MSGTAKEVLQIGRQLAELEEALDDVSDRLSDYRFTIFQINLMGKQDALDSMEEKHAEAMRHFPIDDPYELCFALLYLLDADDDFVWAYSFMTGVACRAACMLPWSIETYDEAYDGFWFDEDAWIPPHPRIRHGMSRTTSETRILRMILCQMSVWHSWFIRAQVHCCRATCSALTAA